MPLDPSRAFPGLLVAAAIAQGCTGAGPSGGFLCSLFGTCAQAAEEADLALPTIRYEPDPIASPPIEGGRLLLRSVTFASGSTEIDPESAIVLDVAAGEILARTAVRIRIEGFTDASGSAERNQELSQRRAESVRRYLVRKGVAAQRLETSARGASSPVASNETEEGRARNRRVELVVP
jgi:OOP family OmpA-OmpF porin